MTIDSPNDLASLKRIGRIVGLALHEMKEQVKPGVTTAELDSIGEALLKRYGARSAPQLVYNFPGATCISINNEAAHGIPGNRKIMPGDLVNLDVSAELDGYFADAGLMVAVPPVDVTKYNLVFCTQRALQKSIAAIRAGASFNSIGKAIEGEAASCGFSTLHDLGGHGVGRGIHEEPHHISCYDNPNEKRVLEDGMVLAIEPFLTTGAKFVQTAQDGWTLQTMDGSLSAQFEHTLVVSKGKPVLITAI